MLIPRSFLHRTTTLALTLLMFAVAGCDSSDPEPTPTTGTISGTITLPAGAGGDIVNTRVSLFETLDEFEANSPTFTASTDASGNFTFQNINPDSYFIAAWKDNNNTARIDGGDFFGVIGTNQVEGFVPTRQQVVAGMNTGFNVTILILPPGFGVSATGTYTGSAQGSTLTMTLTDTNGAIAGSGNIDGTAFTVAGTRTGTNMALQISSPQLVPLTFNGTLSNDGRTFNGTLAGTGNDGSPISVPFTLTRP
ncbi:MAG: hypothetical protein ABJF88_07395 [Rhodothermales bacterium]